mmetsp:Transcript_14447/g.1302  ORF Transcript_14447/g.1302 Transcript_14447/m.1302 type:complete len:86 (+) Transcript_14447:409-666(+)
MLLIYIFSIDSKISPISDVEGDDYINNTSLFACKGTSLKVRIYCSIKAYKENFPVSETSLSFDFPFNYFKNIDSSVLKFIYYTQF